MNDKYSDSLTPMNHLVLSLDKTGVFTKFNTNGKFPQEEALHVWDQIEREGKPIETTFITIKS